MMCQQVRSYFLSLQRKCLDSVPKIPLRVVTKIYTGGKYMVAIQLGLRRRIPRDLLNFRFFIPLSGSKWKSRSVGALF